MAYIDLLLTTGSIARIHVRDRDEGEAHDRVNGAMKTNDWIVMIWDGAKIAIDGVFVEKVHASKVVAEL